jgi:hypothetical protein
MGPLRTFRSQPVDHFDGLDHDRDGQYQPGHPADQGQEAEHEPAIVGHRERVRPVDADEQPDPAP